MNFFKKLLGTQDKTNEQHLEKDRIKSEQKQLLKQQKVDSKRRAAEEQFQIKQLHWNVNTK